MLNPAAVNASKIWNASGSCTVQPKTFPPNISGAVSNPELPSFRFSMVLPEIANTIRVVRTKIRYIRAATRRVRLICEAFFAGGNCHAQSILRYRQRTRCKFRVSTGRIFEVVEIEPQLARLIQTVIRIAGVEKSSGGIRSVAARKIAHHEE